MPPALPILPTLNPVRGLVEQRFWANVDRRGPDECWPWAASRNQWGYGLVRVGKRRCVASRVAWVLIKQTDPGELLVCHTCDNPRCCNPAHMWLGTHADNAHDKTAKKRHVKRGLSSKPKARSNRPKRAPLSPEEFDAIRRDVRACFEVAKQHGITSAYVSMIKNGVRPRSMSRAA